MEPRVVTAVGVAVHSHFGDEAARRLQLAMENAVIQCTREGISTIEENSSVIRQRMRVAHQQELMLITREQHERLVVELKQTHQQKLASFQQAHLEHLVSVEAAFHTEMQSLEASLHE